jgi:hypothetical protein
MASKPVESDISKKIAQRVSEIKASKSYDPRVEVELDEIYNRYVPPHALAQTSHLVDVAERDAYVDPFPPIASNKKAGVFIKKGIRAGFGWYAQFLSQQISTFGSGVSRALRAINDDVVDLKRKVAAKKIPNFIYSLDLDNVDNEVFSDISKTTIDVSKNLKKVIVSGAIDNVFISVLQKSSDHLIIIDERSDACSKVDAGVDSRKQNINEFLCDLEDNSVDQIILSGLINFVELPQRLEIFSQCSRVLNNDGKFVYVASTSNKGFSADQKCALEVFNTNILPALTYTKILEDYFSNIFSSEMENSSNVVFYCSNATIDLKQKS